METEIPDELIDLLELLQEGGLDESGRARLHAMLKERPEFLPMVSTHFTVARALGQLEVAECDFAGRTAAHVAKLATEGEFAFVNRVKRRIVVRRAVKVLSVAAVLTLAALPFFWKPAPPAAVQTEKVAELSRLDKDGSTLRTEVVRAGSRIHESSGLMRLNFENGAVVAVEGPVDFTVVSAKEILLESGRLNAWCPEDAHGFMVRTASAALKDLGTSFGVSATEDGRSEFMVLDGFVEVEKGDEKLLLDKGRAVAANSKGSGALQSVDFKPSPFKKTWLLASGILSTSGSVAPADPDVPEKVALAESDDFVMVIPEKRGVIFNRPLDAEVTEPGSMPGDFDGTVHSVWPVPEKRLRSVLLRYDPVGAWPPDHFLRLSGEVTFDRPVVAISCHRESLEKSDELFATAPWNDIFRGIELVQTRNPPDSVTLSADRRTVSIVFHAGASTDEVRVFLEDN